MKISLKINLKWTWIIVWISTKKELKNGSQIDLKWEMFEKPNKHQLEHWLKFQFNTDINQRVRIKIVQTETIRRKYYN